MNSIQKYKMRGLTENDIDCLRSEPPFIPARVLHEAVGRVCGDKSTTPNVIFGKNPLDTQFLGRWAHEVSLELHDMIKVALETRE